MGDRASRMPAAARKRYGGEMSFPIGLNWNDPAVRARTVERSREVARLKGMGETLRQIAERFGVSRNRIAQILQRRKQTAEYFSLIYRGQADPLDWQGF